MGAESCTCSPFSIDDADTKDTDTNNACNNEEEKLKNDVGSNYYIAANYRKHDQDTKDEFAITRDEYIGNLSDETKKCIAATHLFGSIWYQFFMDEENKCEYIDYSHPEKSEINGDYFNILDHILIRGGCNRDVIWNKDFNDIDAAVNTRELNKLHLLHLKHYHHTKESQEDSKCILWLHYAKKYDLPYTAKETVTDFENDRTGEKIIKSDYMLNAKFLLDILENDERIKDHLSIAIMGRTKRVWNIRIIDELIYGGYDLNGFDFDFLDIKHGTFALEDERDKVEKIHKLHRQQTLKKKNTMSSVGGDDDKFRAMYSIRVQSKLKLFIDIGDNEDYTAKGIELPIYPLVFVTMSKYCDVTVNSMILHFNDVIRDEYGKYTLDLEGGDNIDYDWRTKIKDPSFEIKGIKDCKERNIKTWGADIDDIKDVLKNINPKYHIWRTCKMYIKLNGKGNLDKLLIDAHIQLYPIWFSVDKLNGNENDNYCQEIAKRIINDYAKKGQYNLRFQFLEIVQFNFICKQIMEKIPNFKKYIIEAIENKQDDEEKEEIKKEMKKYAYNI